MNRIGGYMRQCSDYKMLIDKLIDNEITFSEKKEIRTHIKNCIECKQYLERSKKLQKMFSSLTKIETSKDFNVLLRAHIRREMNRRSKRFNNPFALPKRVFQFGFAIVIVFLSLIVFNPFNLIRNKSIGQLQISEKNSNQFNGQIQYVIDGYPKSVSLSRDDKSDTLINRNDSLNLLRENNAIKSHLIPVNF